MKPIPYDPTIQNVIEFINGLNDVQSTEIMNRMNEKQPFVITFMNTVLDDGDFTDFAGAIIYMFITIVRCYDYEYGELPMISEETMRTFVGELSERVQREVKRNSNTKIAKMFRKEAAQNDLVNALDDIIKSRIANHPSYHPSFFDRVKMSNYFMLALMNQEVEKMKQNEEQENEEQAGTTND